MSNDTSQPISSALSPTARMLPPRGCRGALTGWPQLVAALGRINADPAASAKLTAEGGTANGLQLGSPTTLMSALALNPAILHSPSPPAELYAHGLWFSTKFLSAAKTIGATLAQISSIANDPQGLSRDEVAAAVGELIGGEGGLSQLAKSVASAADDYVKRLGALEGPLGVDQALANYKSAGANLEQHAGTAAGAKARDMANFQSATAETAQLARQAIDELEVGAATVSAAAVLGNINAVMRSMAEQWQSVSNNMEAAIAGVNKQQLGDPDYLRQSLGLNDAAAAWKALADSTEVFIQKSLTTNT